MNVPSKSLKPCNHPMCKELTRERYCAKHKKQTAQMYEKERGTATQRGYDSRWRVARKMYLQQHPLCVECIKQGKLVSATVVDHIKPHKGDKRLFWDRNNWQPLCSSCHSTKTAREDGGFGNV